MPFNQLKSPDSTGPFAGLAACINQSEYEKTIQILTTNYDLLVKKVLNSPGTIYFDGFAGASCGRSRDDLSEPGEDGLRAFCIQLSKRHSSVNWENERNQLTSLYDFSEVQRKLRSDQRKENTSRNPRWSGARKAFD